jgi:hypothetical protein
MQYCEHPSVMAVAVLCSALSNYSARRKIAAPATQLDKAMAYTVAL